MNKAKFLLLGIGVIGVVGGALAFKAQKFSGAFICTAIPGDSQCGPEQASGLKYTPASQAPTHPRLFCTSGVQATDCVLTLTVTTSL